MLLATANEIHVPLIVIAEQRAGYSYGSKRAKRERILTKFLNPPGVFVVAPDQQTTFFYADLSAYLRKKEKPIPTDDLWIAALVVQHDLVLFDRDAHFDELPQLARVALPGVAE